MNSSNLLSFFFSAMANSLSTRMSCCCSLAGLLLAAGLLSLLVSSSLVSSSLVSSSLVSSSLVPSSLVSSSRQPSTCSIQRERFRGLRRGGDGGGGRSCGSGVAAWSMSADTDAAAAWCGGGICTLGKPWGGVAAWSGSETKGAATGVAVSVSGSAGLKAVAAGCGGGI